MGNAMQRFEFEGKPLTVIEYKGRPVWIAKEVGLLLGYSNDGGRLVDKITAEWADEFIDGQDVIRLTGPDLRDFKELAVDTTDSVGSKANRALMLLTESGVNLVCIKTEKPLGKAVRRWLAADVMPKVTQAAAAPSAVRVESPADRERRLMLREKRLMVGMQARYIEKLADWLEQRNGDANAIQALRVRGLEYVTGMPAPALLPAESETWYRAGEVASQLSKELGAVISANRIGRWSNEHDLKGDPLYTRKVTDKAAHSDRTVESWQYNDAGVEKLREVARRWLASEPAPAPV